MEDEIADAGERGGAQCRTVADRHERVAVGCVEAAGGEHEAPDHNAAGYGEQTGDERQSGHVRSLVVYGDVSQQADAILDRLQPASCRATAPGRYRTLTCSNAGSAPANGADVARSGGAGLSQSGCPTWPSEYRLVSGSLSCTSEGT